MTDLFNIDVFSHQGKRENNEDSYFPNNEIKTDLNNLFLVCDGVGGHNKGEIASDLCCTQLNAYFSSNKIEVSNQAIIDDAIKFVEKKFDSYMKDNPETIDMASTITLLHLHSQGATVSHMGDSRVYQFRKGEILFRTKDHSLVQELYDQNIITEEEMATHSQRNRISRAMRGASAKSYKADTALLKDLQEGDIFFMCSDGVLESFTDNQLSEVFASDSDGLETLGARIVRKCAENSADNYTGYMIQLTKEYIDSLNILIEEIDGDTDLSNDSAFEATVVMADKNNEKPVAKSERKEIGAESLEKEEEDNSLPSVIVKRSNKRLLVYFIIAIAVAVIMYLGYTWLSSDKKTSAFDNSEEGIEELQRKQKQRTKELKVDRLNIEDAEIKDLSF